MNRQLTALKALVAASLIGGVLVRVLHIASPAKVVFDEVYFPVMANDLLHGKVDFDAHPVLGKALMSLGIQLFGHTFFGDRIVACLFGLGLIALFWYLGRQYFSREKGDQESGYLAGMLLASFVALDCMLIVYSRLGLMDGILLFFIFLAFLHSLRVKGRWGFIGLALVIGACVAIKWLAVGVLAPVAYVLWRRGLLGKLLAVLPISVLFYVLCIFLTGVLDGTMDPITYFKWWHTSVWNYQITLTATHPWSSKWYTWPLMLRPLLMMRDNNPDGTVSVINAIGNPALWYASTVAVLLSLEELIRQKFVLRRPIADHPTVPLLIGWAAFLLPWIPVTRVLFIYHYLPSFAFALMLLTYWLLKLWKSRPWLVIAFLVVTFGLTVFFSPTLVGWPITPADLQLRVWLPSWI